MCVQHLKHGRATSNMRGEGHEGSKIKTDLRRTCNVEKSCTVCGGSKALYSTTCLLSKVQNWWCLQPSEPIAPKKEMIARHCEYWSLLHPPPLFEAWPDDQKQKGWMGRLKHSHDSVWWSHVEQRWHANDDRTQQVVRATRDDAWKDEKTISTCSTFTIGHDMASWLRSVVGTCHV